MFGFIKRTITRSTKKATTATTHKVGVVVNAREIREVAGTTVDLAREVFTPAKSERRETFAHAVLRRGLSEADLATLHRQWAVMCSLFLVFMVSALGLAGYFVAAEDSVAAACAAGGAFLMFLGQYTRAAFRAAQLEQRELFSLSFWLHRPALWTPAWTLPPAPKGPTSHALVRK